MRRYTVKYNNQYVYDVAWGGLQLSDDERLISMQQLERIMVYCTVNEDSPLFADSFEIQGYIVDMVKCPSCGRYSDVQKDKD